MEITYEKIKPIIKKELISGNQISLEFQAENQATPLQTVAFVAPDQEEIKKKAMKQAMKSTVKNTIISRILGFLGIGGIGRRLARTAIDNVSKKNTTDFSKVEITKEKKEKAVVEAFSKFSAMYEYDEQNRQWKYTATQ